MGLLQVDEVVEHLMDGFDGVRWEDGSELVFVVFFEITEEIKRGDEQVQIIIRR